MHGRPPMIGRGQSPSYARQSPRTPRIPQPLPGDLMAYSFTERKRIRKNFGTRDSVLEIPYLLQMQQDAYTAFL